MFPDTASSQSRITCHALCSDFLVYGDDVSRCYNYVLKNRMYANIANHLECLDGTHCLFLSGNL